MRAVKLAAKAEGISDIRVQKAGCLSQCERGISCVVYPEGVWYSLTGEENIPDLLEHLRSGKVAEHLQMNGGIE
jgi:(2Fe-2S) ferredoxin|tara:strand:- start:100 stop:321 length:222 start_codon:yes stop_codon:yes gene_type:complete